MEKEDKTIRMQWLIGWILSLANSIGHLLYQMKFTPPHPLYPHFRSIVFGISLIGVLGSSFLFYYCAYKKPGTKLLLFSLIMNGFFLVLHAISPTLLIPPYITHPYGYFLFNTIWGVVWGILCWRLRQLNQRLKRLAVAEQPES